MTGEQSDRHFQGFMKHIIADALAKVPPGEREDFGKLFKAKPKPEPAEAFGQAAGAQALGDG